jgi:dihydropteroate synthase
LKLRHRFELQIHGRKILLGERTLIMGVLNVTPDSFSDGGLYLDREQAVQHGVEMVRQGADWIDVGGESTRPGSRPISVEEEVRRILPVIRGLRRKLGSVPISIDTTKAEVAEQALRAGASILNDVSGLRFDRRLAEVARRCSVPLILMHLRGRPETMQQKTFARDIWRSLRAGLAGSIRHALAAGVRRSQLIIDPGLGFGKSRRQNFEILAHLNRLQQFRLPIMVGTSRKSFVQAVVAGEGLEPSGVAPLLQSGMAHAGLPISSGQVPPGATSSREKRRSAGYWPVTAGSGAHRAPAGDQSPPLQIGDAAAVASSILAGAHIVRVHDVAAVLPAIRIADAVLRAVTSDE